MTCDYKKYEFGPRNLLPCGNLIIQIINEDSNLYEDFKVVPNLEKEVDMNRGFWGRFFLGSTDELHQYTEKEWVKVGIQEAKKVPNSRLIYLDVGFEDYRKLTIWES